EDAHRLQILSFDEVKNLLLPLCNSENLATRLDDFLEDDDAKVGLLRAKAINTLIHECSRIFHEEQPAILNGNFNQSLTDKLPEHILSAWKTIEKVSVERIYNYKSVIQKEVS